MPVRRVEADADVPALVSMFIVFPPGGSFSYVGDHHVAADHVGDLLQDLIALLAVRPLHR